MPKKLICFPSVVPLIRQRMTVADGFSNEKEALNFGNQACGAACLKMALEAFEIKDVPSVKALMEQGIKNRAFNASVGWIHKGIVKMISRYGLEATNRNIKNDPKEIPEYLNKAGLIIASVSLAFSPLRRGGHLVVLTGALLDETGQIEKLFFRDPSGWGQEHSDVDAEVFFKSWNGNVIFVGKSPISKGKTKTRSRWFW